LINLKPSKTALSSFDGFLFDGVRSGGYLGAAGAGGVADDKN
jgi:hypothetical protein